MNSVLITDGKGRGGGQRTEDRKSYRRLRRRLSVIGIASSLCASLLTGAGAFQVAPRF
jgi:hypothetical protein